MRFFHRLSFRKRFTNRSFLRLFVKNSSLILAGVLLPLVVAVLVLFGFSHRLLLQETDSANRRSLENSKATLDTIRTETEYLTNLFLSSDDVKMILSIPKGEIPNHGYISATNRVLVFMQSTSRQYLDHSILLHTDLSDFTLSTLEGGQSHVKGTQRKLIDTYFELKEQKPEREKFWVGRFETNKRDPSHYILSFYRGIPNLADTERSFVVANVDTLLLTDYLTNGGINTGNILIVNTDGQLLYDSRAAGRPPQPLEEIIADAAATDSIVCSPEGALTVKHQEKSVRISWVTSKHLDWKYVQIIPFDEYSTGMSRLQQVLWIMLVPAFIVAICIALSVSNWLFRPLEEILHLVENPSSYENSLDNDGEISFLLMDILDSFQKNITLEAEMVERRSLLRSARAKALQKQIAPHFLYNALQSIHWLAVMETQLENSRTSQSIITLSELIRKSMEDSGNVTTVGEELADIKKYMEIERLRFGDGINCVYAVEADTLQLPLLRLFLQPLVENAVLHGLGSTNSQGNIYVTVRLEGSDMLYVSVEDSGAGMSEETIAHYEAMFSDDYLYMNRHIGLVNVSQRIKLVYGDSFGLSLSKSEFGGLKVKTIIPKSL